MAAVDSDACSNCGGTLKPDRLCPGCERLAIEEAEPQFPLRWWAHTAITVLAFLGMAAPLLVAFRPTLHEEAISAHGTITLGGLVVVLGVAIAKLVAHDLVERFSP